MAREVFQGESLNKRAFLQGRVFARASVESGVYPIKSTTLKPDHQSGVLVAAVISGHPWSFVLGVFDYQLEGRAGYLRRTVSGRLGTRESRLIDRWRGAINE